MLPKISVYTDGSYVPHTGMGGYAAHFVESQCSILGYAENTTNNRMELMALIAALNSLTVPHHVVFYSDSKYLIDAINQHWLQKWLNNGWKNSLGKAVLNQDLWVRIIEHQQNHFLEGVWVKGHAGHPLNELCDELAKQMSANGPSYF